ncbi:trichohyalin isoform X2 [Perca fluviatilis]|uniref:trichohyalin isoform X2 n=1 Tax=Perca fluviatilis TaxID=8168 RepID=UPI0019641B70|nr:trichohyalin isoform X2 [Perca fluviatilis]
MMSKAPRWPDTLVNSKTNKPAQKTGGKEPAALTVPASSRGKQTGSSTSKTSITVGRSKSLSSRGSDSTASGSKAGGSLKRGSLSHQGHQGTRQASCLARPAFRLCSSRSFSSLHTSSLTAAPFMRSSRSLSRLDQRTTGGDSDHAVSSSQVKKGQTAEKKALNSGQLFSSDAPEHCQIRDNKDQCHGDKAEKMKTSSSSEPLESSSSLVSTTSFRHHCNKPALLNFKKGWMMRKDASGQWQKHWFVLTDQILKFYKDSIAEEAADVDGEINLSTCFDIKDYPAQKNCGFQIHTRDGVYTLGAMTSGMRHNWVQAVLKNVRPSLTLDVTSSLSEQETHQKSQHADSLSVEGLEKAENPDSFLQEQKTSDSAEETHQQQKKVKLQPEAEESSADASSMIASSSAPPRRVEEVEGVTDVSSCVEGAGSDGSTSTTILSNLECLEQQVSINATCERTKEKDKLPCEQQTGQLVKELEQTQKELSRLQQLNRDLQEELKRERGKHSKERVHPQNDPFSNSSSEQALVLQRLQKINHDLHFELEAQKSSQEEAREDELRRRVDLLAQQAQLLVTGDATALAQAQLEQDRRQFREQQMEWERCVATLKAQLSASEEQRREAGLRFTQLQQELQSFHSLQQDADRLHKHLQEVTTQLHANEEAQAQKEARLQKHLTLLQTSQDRERKSLAASLAHAEQHSHDLQKRLDRAEQQVESQNKTHTWTRDIEEAQQQLQEELACTVSTVQKLQEEREQLDHRCQELQNQLCEADEEVSRLQSRLKTDETQYYNLEHSYERVSEELQLALGKVQQKESETQDIREGYERLLDRKEQELSEVLLKMEVLGNSLEDTEVKLNDVLKGCTCAFSQQKDEKNERQTTDLLTVNDSRPNARDSNAVEHAGDYPERFMSVIQMLETKLYVTEEKLRDIMQRLEEHQSHISCRDPHLCSQLTQSRATAQHLSLLLHSQAKQSQRFAQETENRCRMLVGRFQVALNIIQACRERLQATPINITDFEKLLATVAACLQQGEKDAEKQQHESHNESKGEDRILNDETLAGAESNISAQSKPPKDDMESVGKCLMREVFVVEKIVSVLQSQHGIGQLPLTSREDVGDVAQKYKNIISQRIALKTEKRTGRAECDNNGPLEQAIVGVCAEAELIYAALKVQHQYESTTQVNNQEVEPQRKSLADINPPELASYEEKVQGEGRGSEGATKPVERNESDVQKVEAEKEPDWLARLISRLQRRAKSLHQLCQEISDGNAVECRVADNWESASAADLNWMQEQAKLIYLLDRLHSDLEQQQSEVLQDKLQALCEEQDITLKDEQEAFNHTLCQLQEDISVLREELERAEQKIASVETGKQRLLEDLRKIEAYHEERMKKLEMGFQEKIRELQQIHEKEMKHLHGYYTKSSKEKQTKTCTETPALTESTSSLPDQTAAERKTILAGGAAAMREAYQKDLEKLEASCHQGVTAMEEMHRQLIGDLQQQHQTEVAALLKEKDKLLQEETSATMAAIVAMRRAHKQELEKSRSAQPIKESDDIAQLRVEYEKEIQLMHKELEVLSLQHTQRCLENSQLSQDLQDEKQALMQYQKENQELKKKQRETDEMSQLHFSLNGQQARVAPQVNNFYEMEVILRAREAEMQFLRQEARSLREDLKLARMDKIYAQNKLKALYTNSQDEPYHDVNKLCEDVKFATSGDASGQSIEETVTNTSNAAFLKKTEKSSLTRQIRGVRSKSLKEGLSAQERMKLFESF